MNSAASSLPRRSSRKHSTDFGFFRMTFRRVEKFFFSTSTSIYSIDLSTKSDFWFSGRYRSCLERTKILRHVCTLHRSWEFSAVVLRHLFSRSFPPFCSAWEVTYVIVEHFNCFCYLLTYILAYLLRLTSRWIFSIEHGRLAVWLSGYSTSVSGLQTFSDIFLIYDLHVTTLWLRCPLWVNQPG